MLTFYKSDFENKNRLLSSFILTSHNRKSTSVLRKLTQTMADFDTIYEERDEEENAPGYTLATVPDPIVIRGGGNVTM